MASVKSKSISKPRTSIYNFTQKELNILKREPMHPGNTKNIQIYWPLYLETHVSNVHVFNFTLVFNPNQRYYAKLHFRNSLTPLTGTFAKPNLGKKITPKRFIYIVLVINNPLGMTAHANGLLYDTKTEILERFEPHGSENPLPYTKISAQTAKEIKDYLQKNLGLNIKRFNQPKSTCIARGWQVKEGFPRVKDNEFNKQWKINGYCAAWSLYFILLKAKNPDVPGKKLQSDVFANYEETSDTIHDFYYDFLRWKLEFMKRYLV